MKKFACLLLTICMILGVFSGCNKDYHESDQVDTRATTESASEVTTATTTEVPTEFEPTAGVIKKIKNADAVNIRENAGGNYKVVTQLDVGTEITVYEIVTIDSGKKWGRIDQGWILMDLVQLNGR